MNIFKILANGDGSINEPNVSAFLGYLLDPYQDHGLGYMFIESFLNKVIDEDNLKFQDYEYKVYLEQAFKDNDKAGKQKEIVDIVICLYLKNEGKGKETKFINSVINKSELEHVFLIENKINPSDRNDQIKNQLENFNKTLDKLKIQCKSIYSIYLTPDDDKNILAFKEFTQKEKSRHLFWKYKNENESQDDDIVSLLKNLLNSDANFERDPINEYIKYTLKSFIQFINCGFKSELEEKRIRKKDGSYTQIQQELNERFSVFEKLKNLKNFLEIKLKLDDKSLQIVDYRPKDPALIIYISDLSIHLWAGFTERKFVNVLVSVGKDIEKSKAQLSKIANINELILKKPNTKEPYIRIPDLQKKIEIDNKEMIYETILEAVKFLRIVTKY